MLLIVGLVVVVVMWPLSLWGHAIGLTPSWHQLMNRDKAWMHDHYALVGLRYVGAATLLLCLAAGTLGPLVAKWLRVAGQRTAEQQRQQAAAHRRWLMAPPERCSFPPRFTQEWIAANVPRLHPGQVPMLTAEMKARGWTEARIDARVGPFLDQHRDRR
jgi:hypothetical protein